MGLLRNRHDTAAGTRHRIRQRLLSIEYETTRDGDTVATVSKRWFAVRETYGVAVAPGADDALVRAVTVCIDTMSHPRD